MRFKEGIKSVTEAETRDLETYQALRDATVLLQLAAQGEADLPAGRILPQDQALARVRSRLRK
jgi:hypothetical protein